MISQIVSAAGRKMVADQGPYPLYSTGDWQRGSTDDFLRLFNYTTGDPVSRTTKTVQTVQRTSKLRDTNVATKGKMAAQEGMLITSIRLKLIELQAALVTGAVTYAGQQPAVQLFNMEYADLQLMLRLYISNKPYEESAIQWYAAGYGAYATMAGTAGTVTSIATNGFPSHDAARYVPQPHIILPDEKYHVDILNTLGAAVNWQAASGGTESATQIRFRCHLDGTKVRDVGVLGDNPAPDAVYEKPIISPYNVQAG
jgi:hypothetical protein